MDKRDKGFFIGRQTHCRRCCVRMLCSVDDDPANVLCQACAASLSPVICAIAGCGRPVAGACVYCGQSVCAVHLRTHRRDEMFSDAGDGGVSDGNDR